MHMQGIYALLVTATQSNLGCQICLKFRIICTHTHTHTCLTRLNLVPPSASVSSDCMALHNGAIQMYYYYVTLLFLEYIAHLIQMEVAFDNTGNIVFVF